MLRMKDFLYVCLTHLCFFFKIWLPIIENVAGGMWMDPFLPQGGSGD